MAVASAMVLLVIERLFEDTRLGDGASVMAMAFGPALTLYAALVCRRCEP
jgi:predicted naringenin-chalcone synthase